MSASAADGGSTQGSSLSLHQQHQPTEAWSSLAPTNRARSSLQAADATTPAAAAAAVTSGVTSGVTGSAISSRSSNTSMVSSGSSVMGASGALENTEAAAAVARAPAVAGSNSSRQVVSSLRPDMPPLAARSSSSNNGSNGDVEDLSDFGVASSSGSFSDMMSGLISQIDVTLASLGAGNSGASMALASSIDGNSSLQLFNEQEQATAAAAGAGREKLAGLSSWGEMRSETAPATVADPMLGPNAAAGGGSSGYGRPAAATAALASSSSQAARGASALAADLGAAAGIEASSSRQQGVGVQETPYPQVSSGSKGSSSCSLDSSAAEQEQQQQKYGQQQRQSYQVQRQAGETPDGSSMGSGSVATSDLLADFPTPSSSSAFGAASSLSYSMGASTGRGGLGGSQRGAAFDRAVHPAEGGLGGMSDAILSGGVSLGSASAASGGQGAVLGQGDAVGTAWTQRAAAGLGSERSRKHGSRGSGTGSSSSTGRSAAGSLVSEGGSGSPSASTLSTAGTISSKGGGASTGKSTRQPQGNEQQSRLELQESSMQAEGAFQRDSILGMGTSGLAVQGSSARMGLWDDYRAAVPGDEADVLPGVPPTAAAGGDGGDRGSTGVLGGLPVADFRFDTSAEVSSSGETFELDSETFSVKLVTRGAAAGRGGGNGGGADFGRFSDAPTNTRSGSLGLTPEASSWDVGVSGESVGGRERQAAVQQDSAAAADGWHHGTPTGGVAESAANAGRSWDSQWEQQQQLPGRILAGSGSRKDGVGGQQVQQQQQGGGQPQQQGSELSALLAAILAEDPELEAQVSQQRLLQ